MCPPHRPCFPFAWDAGAGSAAIPGCVADLEMEMELESGREVQCEVVRQLSSWSPLSSWASAGEPVVRWIRFEVRLQRVSLLVIGRSAVAALS